MPDPSPRPLPTRTRLVGAPVRCGTDPSDQRVRFAPAAVLTKEEVFGACQALADAGRSLVRAGDGAEADMLCSLFVLLEERLVAR